MRWIDQDQLDSDDQQLLNRAVDAAKTACAGQSNYHVGAALRVIDSDGIEHVVTGNNFETVTYKSCCAEKHALMRAMAEHSKVLDDGSISRPEVLTVAVHCARGGEPQQPCGDCRQTLSGINPDMIVIAGAGPDDTGYNDKRVTITGLRSLLPNLFDLQRAITPDPLPIMENDSPEEHCVHLPQPADLQWDKAKRVELLKDMRYLLLVGSPSRAKKVAEWAAREHQARTGCYCDIGTEKRNESGREFSLFAIKMPGGPTIGVASHGVGLSGVEIVLSEVPALLDLVHGSRKQRLKGIIRAGTRGTISQVPVGSIALSTACYDEHYDVVKPDAQWLEWVRCAARDRGMTSIQETEVNKSEANGQWPEAPEKMLVEGGGLATVFFWEGQGRPMYHSDPEHAKASHEADMRRRYNILERAYHRGIKWIEMEDYTVLRIAQICAIPAVTMGAILASRRTAQGTYQVDYSHEAYTRSGLIPTELAIETFLLADKA